MQTTQKTYNAIKQFLLSHTDEIQKLATQHHKDFLGGKKFRSEVIEKYQNNHREIVAELANHLEQEDIKKGLTVFKKLAERVAIDSVNDGLHIEEAVDGIIFLKQALWEKVKEQGLLDTLSIKEFYHISQIIGIYIDTVASQIAFAYHAAHTEKVAEELSKRQRSEQTLIDERKYAQDIVETVREPLIVLDDNLRVVSANKSFYHTFSVSEEETHGKLIYELGNGQWNIPELKTLLNEIIPQKKQFTDYEVKHTFEQIGQKIMLLNARKIDSVKLILLAIEDITERKKGEKALQEREEQFRTLADNVPNLVWMAKSDGWIFWYNKRWYEYTGTTPEQMQGWGWQSLHDPNELPRVLEQWRWAIAHGEPSEMIFPLKGADGIFRQFLTRIIPIKNEKGHIIRWFGTNTDITKQKELEMQKEEFMGIASHELKTPVTSLKVFTQVLQRRLVRQRDEESAIVLKKMEAQVAKLDNLIKDLLDVTRIEGSRLQFNEKVFDFDKLVDEIIEEIQWTTDYHTIQREGRIKKSILGDRERIGQVITNFLTNAIKYSPDSKKILVKTSANKDSVTLCVQDSGVGIAKEKLPHVFERFYRETENGTTFPGIGLGLYISREIIERQEGRIWAESEKGKGSSFCFTLPRIKKS